MAWGPMGTKNVVGLDIDTGEIRAVELSGNKVSPKLVRYGSSPLPDEAFIQGKIADPGLVEDALRQLWSAVGLNKNKIILGVFNQEVLVRLATIPKIAGSKIDRLIKFQAQEYIPFPLESVVLDHLVIGGSMRVEGAILDVLLVAGKRDMLNIFIEVISGAGLTMEDIQVSAFALQQLIPGDDLGGATVAVVNIANGQSSILVVEGETPRFARTLSTGAYPMVGEDLVGSPEDFSRWLETLANEINSSLNFYQTQYSSASLERILLSGPGARMEGLASRLKDKLGFTTGLMDPLQGITISPRNHGIKDRAEDFAVSIALARQGLEV